MNNKELLMNINCTGCTSCVLVCPNNCITMVESDEGFLIPEIDETVCVGCMKCHKICPENKCQELNVPLLGYVAVSKDENLYLKSSSGGVFAQLAKYFLEQGGTVCGAAFDEKFEVRHIAITSLYELYKLQGSKYVQSNLNCIFKEVKKLIASKKKVLFSGTPCQVAGLYAYLNGRYSDLLITVDLVCHGVASPGFFRKYLDEAVKRQDAKLIQFAFRIKDSYEKTGFRIFKCYSNSKNQMIDALNDPYYSLYLKGSDFRESCYQCKYTVQQRIGDITLGDCGSYKKYIDTFGTKAISIVFLNTQKGFCVWNEIQGQFDFMQADINTEVKANKQLNESVNRPEIRNTIYQDIRRMTISQLKKKYVNYSLKNRVVYLIKRSVPYQVRYWILKIIRGRGNG